MFKFVASTLIAMAGATVSATAAVAAPPTAPQVVRVVAVDRADPTKLAEARAIITVMFPASERRATLENMMANLLKPMRAQLAMNNVTDPDLRKLLNDVMSRMLSQSRIILLNHFPAILDATASAYAHEFTFDELKQIHAFAMTQAGGHYLHASIGMLGDPAVQNANAALAADVQTLQKAALDEAIPKIIAFVKAHPETESQLRPKPTS